MSRPNDPHGWKDWAWDVIEERDLSMRAIAVLLALVEYGNAKGEQFPSERELARRLHKTRKVIGKGLAELVTGGVIEDTTERYRGATIYRLVKATSGPTEGPVADRVVRPPSGPAPAPVRPLSGPPGPPEGEVLRTEELPTPTPRLSSNGARAQAQGRGREGDEGTSTPAGKGTVSNPVWESERLVRPAAIQDLRPFKRMEPLNGHHFLKEVEP